MTNIAKYLNDNSITFEENVSLKNKTWLKTGGTAGLWITPNTVAQLQQVSAYLTGNSIEYEVIGHTSNIYFLDTYNPSIIVSTSKLKKFVDQLDYIECECGVPVSILSRYAVEQGYIGYAGLVNLPGTIGAAICNNSNCFDCSVSEHLIDATFWNSDKREVCILHPKDLDYSHRYSRLKDGTLKGVVLTIRLSKVRGFVDEERTKAENATIIRNQTQEPPAYTLGSVYASLVEKKCLQNIIYSYYGSLLRHFNLNNSERLIKGRLYIYGFIDLIPFVSKKNLNTFIWLRGCKDIDAKFNRYKQFMNRVFENPKLEIEIRG